MIVKKGGLKMIIRTNDYGKTIKITHYGNKVISYIDNKTGELFFQPNFPALSITNEDNARYIQQKVDLLISELVEEVMKK